MAHILEQKQKCDWFETVSVDPTENAWRVSERFSMGQCVHSKKSSERAANQEAFAEVSCKRSGFCRLVSATEKFFWHWGFERVWMAQNECIYWWLPARCSFRQTVPIQRALQRCSGPWDHWFFSQWFEEGRSHSTWTSAGHCHAFSAANSLQTVVRPTSGTICRSDRVHAAKFGVLHRGFERGERMLPQFVGCRLRKKTEYSRKNKINGDLRTSQWQRCSAKKKDSNWQTDSQMSLLELNQSVNESKCNQ